MIDVNRDGNRGELWRTSANTAERKRLISYTGRTPANCGELKLAALKTTKVQAFGGSNPSPSAPSAVAAPVAERLVRATVSGLGDRLSDAREGALDAGALLQ